MSRVTGLVTVEGVSGSATMAAAKALASSQRRSALSLWDASGILGEVGVADVGAGQPSARTLVLLYAADLAFRWHREVRPALAAERLVVATPWVATARAFGLACGLDEGWLDSVFAFAPHPDDAHTVDDVPDARASERRGFVDFGCTQLLSGADPRARAELLARTAVFLKAASRASRGGS